VPRVQPFYIGCEPSPSVPAETLLQDGWKTYLLFFAVSKAIDESGYLRDLGVAVLDCQHCVASKFGYPNDEGLPEHPYYRCGMSELATSVLEVVDSPWVQEVTDQRVASARRIWERRGMDWSWARGNQPRHFILTLKEKTLECLASSLVVERFCETFDAAYAHVIEEFSKH
jgi:hypothetical protein